MSDGTALGARRALLAIGLPASAAMVVAGALLLVVDGRLVNAAGYLLACLLPFLLVAAQRREAVQTQARSGQVRPGHERWLASAVLVAGLVVAACHAWRFAWDVA